MTNNTCVGLNPCIPGWSRVVCKSRRDAAIDIDIAISVQIRAAEPTILSEARAGMAYLLKGIKAHETDCRRGKVVIRWLFPSLNLPTRSFSTARPGPEMFLHQLLLSFPQLQNVLFLEDKRCSMATHRRLDISEAVFIASRHWLSSGKLPCSK